tara:strand:- start:260 stop:391 length:132 start_codon:yes stop_codon:yes gene_type:complete
MPWQAAILKRGGEILKGLHPFRKLLSSPLVKEKRGKDEWLVTL